MPRGKHGNHARGTAHPRWKGGQTVSSHGYLKLHVGKGHHLADPNGYAYEHQIIAESVIGRPLGLDEVVHHRNGKKTDNRPANLEVLSRCDHAKEHYLDRPKDEHGRLTTRTLPPPLRNRAGQFVGQSPKSSGDEVPT
jgi:hypothetical protein